MWPPLPGCFSRTWHISWISKEMKEFIREEERGRYRFVKYPFSLCLLSLFAVLRLGVLSLVSSSVFPRNHIANNLILLEQNKLPWVERVPALIIPFYVGALIKKSCVTSQSERHSGRGNIASGLWKSHFGGRDGFQVNGMAKAETWSWESGIV